MDWFIDMIMGWDQESQLGGFIAVLGFGVLTLVVLARILSTTLSVILRGYPPSYENASLPECNHDENKTNVCLKPGGCKTFQECEKTIELLNRGGDV